ncbi:Endogenous retrovirus group FC1 Env polyprotein [Plecturocebus cupreus]
MPVGAAAVPEADPNWDYQDDRDGCHRRDQMLHCNTTVKVRSTHYAPPGGYFWCNGTLTKVINASLPLPCVPVTLVPQLKVYGQAEFQSLLTPLPPPTVCQNKRAIFLPVVVGLSLASSLVAAGIGSGAMGYSVTSAAQLEDKLRVAIEASAASLASLQRQITSLAQEECCYYINESGLVEENINTLHRLQEDLRKKQNTGVLSLGWWHPMLTWLTPVITPIIVICLLLLMAPFLLRFLQTRMREIGRVAINQMLLHPFVRLPVEAPAN